ncbi:MAG: dCTP deaminase [Phycisphaeraceae bacterium]
MILSNVSIHEALDKGWLKISPEPSPRKLSVQTQECPYQTSSVDLHLGSEVSWFKEGLAINIDLRRGGFAKLFGPNSERREITDDQPFSLKPGLMVNCKTLEKIELPVIDSTDSPCLAARVEGRSSYARCGLLVHFTAPTIHAGFTGTITLELINLGTIPILLYPKAPICQLIVEQVHGVPFRNDSQFQGQTKASGEK